MKILQMKMTHRNIASRFERNVFLTEFKPILFIDSVVLSVLVLFGGLDFTSTTLPVPVLRLILC